MIKGMTSFLEVEVIFEMIGYFERIVNQVRVYVKRKMMDVDSWQFMKRNFYHENAKVGKHENFISFISCFRHFVLS